MSSSASGLNLSSANKDEVKQRVRKEMAMANAQELVNNINKNCYQMCLSKNPGTSISSSDETCLARCMDKFLASWDVVSRAYVSRVQQEGSP
ncbi:protein translocase subunit [Coemansia asiatica]|uniref:Mitochondrial import inner membrane translocase subunit n=1 Tax=Coemansia asiatica TaxID=1052880 RepID=A0A9W8CM52_9FUNG|nr:protein translocase subunit [Coemansia asiatica]